MDTLINDAVAALLTDHCSFDAVRAIEAGTPATDLWQALLDGGFADILVPESAGGAGLAVTDAGSVWQLLGRYAMPIPLGETMIARALLASQGLPAPDQPIALGQVLRGAQGGIACQAVNGARSAAWVLAADEQDCRLLPIAKARATPATFVLDLNLEWDAKAWQDAASIRPAPGLRALQAMLLAAQLSGALSAVFQRTLAYANDRVQFGKPIGKFQAIQHQLSVLAEEAFAAQMAAQLGCQTRGLEVDPLKVAIAKARTSEAALQGAQLAHAIHGAIGFTAEFDLQLLTRRLHAWRQAAGSESYWHRLVGQALIESDHALSLEVLRAGSDLDAHSSVSA